MSTPAGAGAAPPDRPTGTVTFLFSDIEGSTQRLDAHREAMTAALRRHDALQDQAAEEALRV